MKASTLITLLQQYIDQTGDKEVVCVDDEMKNRVIDGLWLNPYTDVYKLSITEKPNELVL